MARGAKPDSKDDATARRLMAAVEKRQRAGHLMLSMDLVVTTGGGSPTRRRMLAVTRGDPEMTRVVYVVTVPELERGTTLLIEDPVSKHSRDHLWLWLPGLMSPRELEAISLRALVPGTGLTYEDARGWISTDKYHFRSMTADSEEVTIEARPVSDSLVTQLGVSKLVVRVDPRRSVVTGMVAYDPAGNPARTYEATEFVEVAGRWYPRRAETHHQLRKIDASIVYDYRALDRPPPPELFRIGSDGEAYLRALGTWRARLGLAEEFPDTLAGP